MSISEKQIFVALLRGINVGGNNKIAMADLKKTFGKVGMENVKTYINSGNVIFTSQNSKKSDLSKILEAAIEKDFGLKIKVLVRKSEDFQEIIKNLPESWKNDKEMKSDVMFLWDEIDSPKIKEQLTIKPQIDTVKYLPGTILWKVDRKKLSKSGMQNLVGTKTYKQMTIRNVNTTRKIYKIIKEY